MKKVRPKKTLPLVHALAWIVGSTFVINAAAYNGLKFYLKKTRSHARAAIVSIVQTGPQKEALKTECLAEWLGLSADRSVGLRTFDVKKAEKLLQRYPLIKKASLKVIPPGGLYIDYTVRQPVAWVYDFENMAIDKEGYLFPVRPFLTPKVLPELYLGLSAFGETPPEDSRPTALWGRPLEGKYMELALSLLRILTDYRVRDLIPTQRIDVSDAFHESYGKRQIVISIEDQCVISRQGKLVTWTIPRLLRLTTKNYTQELGNYLKLRQELLQQEQALVQRLEVSGDQGRLEPKVIDFRISGLAFVDEATANPGSLHVKPDGY